MKSIFSRINLIKYVEQNFSPVFYEPATLQINKKKGKEWASSLSGASRPIRTSAKPALKPGPAESPHGLGGMAEIIHNIKTKPCPPR